MIKLDKNPIKHNLTTLSLSWPSCLKLTMSLVKSIVKTLTIKYGIYANIFAEKKWVAFALAKATHNCFSKKNICELDIVLTRTVIILTTNELVKLTTFWTSEPRFLTTEKHQWLKHWWLVYRGWFELVFESLGNYFGISKRNKYLRIFYWTKDILMHFSYLIMKMYILCTH